MNATLVALLSLLTGLASPRAPAPGPSAPAPGVAGGQDLRDDPRFEEASRQYLEGDRDEAARAFARLADLPGALAEDQYAIASFYYGVQDWARCLPYAVRANERLEESPQSYLMLGVCRLYLGFDEQAATSLAEAVRRFPEHAALHYNLGLAHARLQRPLQAEECYLRALELRPTESLFLFTAGENAMLLLRNEEAVKRFQAAASVDEAHPLAACRAATALADLGRSDEARVWFQKGLETAKGAARAETQMHFGVYLYDLGRHEPALKRFELATNGNPRLRLAWQYRARCLRALGRMEEATAAVERYRQLQQQEDDIDEQYLLSILARHLGIEKLVGAQDVEREDQADRRDEVEAGEGGGDRKGSTEKGSTKKGEAEGGGGTRA